MYVCVSKKALGFIPSAIGGQSHRGTWANYEKEDDRKIHLYMKISLRRLGNACCCILLTPARGRQSREELEFFWQTQAKQWSSAPVRWSSAEAQLLEHSLPLQRTGVCFQHPHGGSPLSVSFPGEPTSSFCIPWALGIHVVHINAPMQAKVIHMKQIKQDIITEADVKFPVRL